MQSTNSSDFAVTYVPEKNKDLEFEIRPMTNDRIAEINMITSGVFITMEPFWSSTGATHEDLHIVFEMLGNDCMKNGLGLACYEKKTGELAAAIYNGDAANEVTFDDQIEVAKVQGRNKLIENLLMLKDIASQCEAAAPGTYKKPANKGEALHLNVVCCVPKYQNLGIITRMVRFMLNEHPVIKNYKHIVSEAYTPGSRIPFERNGFKVVHQVLFKDFEKDGKRPLAHIEDTLKSKGYRPSDGMRCMVYDKE